MPNRHYVGLHIEKLKSDGAMQASWEHNYRIGKQKDRQNEKTKLNIEHVDNPAGKSFTDLFYEKISEAKAVTGSERKIRKNAVRALEIHAWFSKEKLSSMDFEKWKEDTLAYIQQKFNTEMIVRDKNGNPVLNPDGSLMKKKTDNVISAVLHMDEQSPHFHFIVVPIDENGNLNAFRYVKNDLHIMQDEYAKAIQVHNPELKRGEKYSAAIRERVSEFYDKVSSAVCAELPAPRKGQTAKEYKETIADKEYSKALVHLEQERDEHRRDIFELQSQIDQANADLRKRRRRMRAFTGGNDMDDKTLDRALEDAAKMLAQRRLASAYGKGDKVEAFDKAILDSIEEAKAAIKEFKLSELQGEKIDPTDERFQRYLEAKRYFEVTGVDLDSDEFDFDDERIRAEKEKAEERKR